MHRHLLASVLSGALLLLGTSTAQAEIRSGTASDPSDPSAVDIIGASATYDTGGRATASVTVLGNVSTNPFRISVTIASFLEPDVCTGTSISIFGSATDAEGFFMQSNTSGVGSAPFTASGDTLSVLASDAALAGKDYQCAEISVTSPDGGTEYDSVTVFFKGFGPPVCELPKLSGLTLAKAKVALTKANCKLGRRTGPAAAKKGQVLVVSKAKLRDDGSNKVDLTVRAKRKR